jgi:hypothetical protein
MLHIEDGRGPDKIAANGAVWEIVSDRVMGGVSGGSLQREDRLGHSALVLRGRVSLENQGGFLQMALDLAPRGQVLDASPYRLIRMAVQGNGARYNLHLRTSELTQVQQSYRASFTAAPRWQVLDIPLSDFVPHRTSVDLNLAKLRRIGVVAIGQEMEVDLALGALAFVA